MTPSDVTRIIERLDKAIERLAVLETKLDTHSDCDDRIGSLERWRAFLTGVVALIVVEVQVLGVVMAIKGAGHG